MTQRHATPEAAQEAAQEWTDLVLECRTYGHTWQPDSAAWTKDRTAITTTQVCPRCECVRRTLLDGRTGWVMSSHIDYPDGYLLKGVGRMTGDAKGALRLTLVGRVHGLRFPRKRAS